METTEELPGDTSSNPAATGVMTSGGVDSDAAYVDEDTPPPLPPPRTVSYESYQSELQMPDIMQLMKIDLSEPYSIYTYRYFIHNWPQLCILVSRVGWRVASVNPSHTRTYDINFFVEVGCSVWWDLLALGYSVK